MKMDDNQHKQAFHDELHELRERIQKRAKHRIEKAAQKYEEEERQKRIGPEGLDPFEVVELLPKVDDIRPKVFIFISSYCVGTTRLF